MFADTLGNFIWSRTPVGPYVTATDTDDDENTSVSSAAVSTADVMMIDRYIPERFTLDQNVPNPFPAKSGSAYGGNPAAAIRFSMKKSYRSVLKVIDLIGRKMSKISDGKYQQGEYEVPFDASRLPSGIYLYRIETENYRAVRKMVSMD